MHRLRWGWVVICGMVLLVACGGSSIPIPVTPTPIPATDTPVPTAAPTATSLPPTATVAPTATPLPATNTPAPQATPTRASASATSTPRPAVSPTSAPVSRVPIGAAPSGWKTYAGASRAPFAIFYPPNWTVDESDLTNNGTVEFKGPGGAPILSIKADSQRTTTSIDTLRDQQAKTLSQVCARSGVELTDRVTLSDGVVFNDLLEVCDPPQQGASQLVWLIGAGLNNGYPWYFDGLSFRKDYSKSTCNCPAGNLESFFVPMLNSLRIYANPVG